MKRLFTLLFLFVMGANFVFALTARQEASLAKLRREIKRIDQQIFIEKIRKKPKRIKTLRALKREKIRKAQQIKQRTKSRPRIIKKPTPAKKAIARRLSPKANLKAKRWIVGGGLSAGTGMVDLGYILFKEGGRQLILESGYGWGNSYTVSKAQVAMQKRWGKGLISGIEGGVANYGVTVQNVWPLKGQIPSGTRYCLGVYQIFKAGDWQIKVGLNNGLGAIASLRILF